MIISEMRKKINGKTIRLMINMCQNTTLFLFHKYLKSIKRNNKRAQRALGRSPDEKVKGQGEGI